MCKLVIFIYIFQGQLAHLHQDAIFQHLLLLKLVLASLLIKLLSAENSVSELLALTDSRHVSKPQRRFSLLAAVQVYKQQNAFLKENPDASD